MGNLEEQLAPNAQITSATSVSGNPWIKTANEFYLFDYLLNRVTK